MIALDIADGVVRLTLHRPAARNALDPAGWRALAEAVATVAASDARVAIVGSAVAGAFCAGADLAEIAALAEAPAERAGFRARMRAALDPLHTLPIPTIAAVDGGCFGAGVALALACDIRIAGDDARFAVTPARLGIAYPRTDVDRLRQAVGHAQTVRLLCGAVAIDAVEAARIGLVQIAVADARGEAETLAAAIAANAPSSVRVLHAMLGGAPRDDDSAFDAMFDGADLREGLAAFAARRAPAFGG